MFGTFRLFLALLVVVGHLVDHEPFAHFGYYAVRVFFILSGFVLTGALNEVYQFDATRFAVNRLLRLVPLYYVVCAATLAVISRLPEAAFVFMPRWNPDFGAFDVVLNLLILPLESGSPGFRFAEPAWSLAVELMMYVLLWLGISRGPRPAAIAFVAGALFHIVNLAIGAPFAVRYFSPASAVMSFSIGALIYFYGKRASALLSPRVAAMALSFWLANLFCAGWIFPDHFVGGVSYYASTLLGAVIIGGLARLPTPPRLAVADRLAGELAYPVFLVHWLAAFVTFVAFPQLGQRGWPLMLGVLPLLLALSIALAMINALVIEPMRRRIRVASAKPPAEAYSLARAG